MILSKQNSSTLDLQGVSKVYGSGETQVMAVDNVTMQVAKGDVVLIMGPSGSGKTTLLSIAGALLRPTSGSVKIAGQEVTAMSESRLPRLRLETIGFIFQSFNLLSALNSLENVQVVLDFAGVPTRKSRKVAGDLLGNLGLGQRLRHYPSQLSGGEKQRVAIARALANDPGLIFADEPTANLDSKTGHVVVELLHKISKEQGKSVVIVSHDMRIMDIADRVLQLEDGRLREGAAFLAKDPVCGMVVPQEKAVATYEHGGTMYFFCSRTCKETFVNAH